MNDAQLLGWVRFNATKFVRNEEGWTYSRDLGDLKHIRYTSDYTGYERWWRRLGRAFDPRALLGFTRFGHGVGHRVTLAEMWSHIVVNLRKDTNLPDGMVSGDIITPWEEDGEYIVMMGPSVGVKVLDFLEAEPENPHAVAIVNEMRRMYEKSWGE